MSENLQAAEQHNWSQMASKAGKIKVIDTNDPQDTWIHNSELYPGKLNGQIDKLFHA